MPLDVQLVNEALPGTPVIAEDVGGNPALPAIDGSQVTGITATQVGAIPDTEKGAPNGVAELDGTGVVPYTQLPSELSDYAGRFEAATITTGNIGTNKWGWWWDTVNSRLLLVRNRSGVLYGVEANPL